jgi:hypothetical protein
VGGGVAEKIDEKVKALVGDQGILGFMPAARFTTTIGNWPGIRR